MSSKNPTSVLSGSSLRRRFVLVFALVALVAVMNAAAIDRAMREGRDDGHLINVAGRQRMLSQKIAKLALSLEDASDSSDLGAEQRRRVKLGSAFDEFRESHIAVRDRLESAGFSGDHSESVRKKFEDLQPVYLHLAAIVHSAYQSGVDNPDIDATLNAAERYLRGMNEIVFELAQESEDRSRRWVTLTWLGAALSVLLVGAAGALVLNPALAALKLHQQQFDDAFQKLLGANQAAKEALESNRRALGFTSAILQTAADSIIVINEEGEIVRANEAATEMFGAGDGGLVGEDITSLMPEDLAAKHHSFVANATTSGRTGLLQRARRVTAQRLNGERFSIDLSISRVSGVDEVYFAGVARDVSEQQAMEARLAQAERLESVGTLAAGVAHEINTPLQFVSTNLRYLESQVEPAVSAIEQAVEVLQGDDVVLESAVADSLRNAFGLVRTPEMKAALGDCSIGCSRITEIVRAMKEYVHASNEMERIDLNDLVQQAVVITRNRTKHSAEVELELAGEAALVCNRSAISQTIVNLIVNATDAIDELPGGSTLGRITLRTESTPTEVVLVCEDDGNGMPDSVKKRAFDPFFTTKDVGIGSGQGLAIAYKSIVQLHGGEILVESEVGAGSTFRLRLPRERAAKPPTPETAHMPALA